jgi:hypothetical protein
MSKKTITMAEAAKVIQMPRKKAAKKRPHQSIFDMPYAKPRRPK